MSEFISLFRQASLLKDELERNATKVANGEWISLAKSEPFRDEAGDPIRLRAHGREVDVPFIDPETPALGRNLRAALLELNGGNLDFNLLGVVDCKFAPMDSGPKI